MKAKYSGIKSRKFWFTVNVLDGGNYQELHSLGCALQNLEEFVLKALKDAQESDCGLKESKAKEIEALFLPMPAKITVCENHSVNPTEFGISFTGYNPESKDYFKMIDCETADRLCNYLNNLK